MATAQAPVNNMFVTVKLREVQRSMVARMHDDQTGAARHLFAVAHLGLVLADDYAQAERLDLALRSHLRATSCLWRTGHPTKPMSSLTR